MPDPIKVQVMQSLETLLAEIPEIGSVQRWYEIPVDLDTWALPALFYWEEEERHLRNRIVWNELHLYLAVFFRLESADGPGYQRFSDTADDLAAKIHNKLLEPGALAASGTISLTESWVRKALANELFGELSMTFMLTYGHTKGDAFSIAL